jgi:hypothetical protein
MTTLHLCTQDCPEHGCRCVNDRIDPVSGLCAGPHRFTEHEHSYRPVAPSPLWAGQAGQAGPTGGRPHRAAPDYTRKIYGLLVAVVLVLLVAYVALHLSAATR